jgi:3-oxoacyl-[acyl-carrier-protein] synthase II
MTRVVVTGVGALSPFGAGADALWRGVLAGRSAIGTIARLVAAGLPVTTGAEVALELDAPARALAMSRAPIDEALVASGLAAADTALFWANGLDAYDHDAGALVERSAGACFTAIARAHARPRRMIATACASATQAIGHAFHAIRAGRARAAVAGGATVMLCPHYVTGFAALQALALDRAGQDPSSACRPFDRSRRGFTLGEGGGALVLEALDAARGRGATVLAEVLGFGSSQDAFDLNRPPADGAGAELCVRAAIADAGASTDRIGAVNAHATGTRAGDPAEAAALRRVLGERWRTTPVVSVKGGLGHAMAAAGAHQAIVAIATCRTGLVPPTANLSEPDDDCELDHVIGRPRAADVPAILSSSFGMGGQNACVVLARSEEPA